MTEPGARVVDAFDQLGNADSRRRGQCLGVGEILGCKLGDVYALFRRQLTAHGHALGLSQETAAAFLALKGMSKQNGGVAGAVWVH
jgi:hypothetical protein